MGKSKRGNKEYTREQRLIKENQALKRELARTKKILARVDLDRYEQVREIIQEHYANDRKDEVQEILDKMKKEWACHKCGTGYLEIILYNKINSVYYYRQCNKCNNRTKSQKYDMNQVRGIIKNPS